MRISAMSYFDRVHTSMLTDLVNLSWPSESLPNIFRALKVGINSLELFYQKVEEAERMSTRVNWLEKPVPYPVWLNPTYIFKEVLSKPSDSEKYLYLAEDDQKRMVVIKFARRYGEEVHKAWHNVGFAPKLFDVQQLAGGFNMIVMEYLGPPWQILALLDTETKRRARLVVGGALQKVHRLQAFVDGERFRVAGRPYSHCARRYERHMVRQIHFNCIHTRNLASSNLRHINESDCCLLAVHHTAFVY